MLILRSCLCRVFADRTILFATSNLPRSGKARFLRSDRCQLAEGSSRQAGTKKKGRLRALEDSDEDSDVPGVPKMPPAPAEAAAEAPEAPPEVYEEPDDRDPVRQAAHV